MAHQNFLLGSVLDLAAPEQMLRDVDPAFYPGCTPRQGLCLGDASAPTEPSGWSAALIVASTELRDAM